MKSCRSSARRIAHYHLQTVGGLWTVSANGGTPQPLLKTDVEKDRVCYSDPQILPGGKSVLFTLASGRAVTADDQDVAVLDPGGREPRILIRGASHPRYLPTGHVVYVHAGALLAVTFDVMPDGEHFVFLLEQSLSPTHYNVVLHWFEELKQRVPVK
jgi:hypothetical protein